ncbi:hypothetical protein H5410_014950, partial [Solanum commersonii]
MDECIDETKRHSSPKRQEVQDVTYITWYILLGSFIFIPPPLERSRKIDAKLGVLEKSEYLKFGATEH